MASKNFTARKFSLRYGGKIGGLINNGVILLIPEVIKELEKKDDDVSKWIQPYKNKYQKYNNWGNEAGQEFASLSAQYGVPKKPADLKIIAWAKVTGATVVMLEKQGGGKNKIPDICGKEKINCTNMLVMMKDQGWTFP